MKKILCFFVILLLACVAYSANLTVTNTDTRNGTLITCPSDLVPVMMYDSTETSVDTFAANVVRVWGPYSLTYSVNEPMYKEFTFYITSVTGTTPSFAVDYCLTQTSAYRDTAGNLKRTTWTNLDTVATATNGFQKRVDLSSSTARYVWFRYKNLDSDAAQIPLPSYVVFKKATKYFK